MPHDLRQTRQGVAIGAGPCRFEEVTVTALDGLPSELGQQAARCRGRLRRSRQVSVLAQACSSR